ncbi:hypothetical protein M3O96_01205 [Aquiflexum sp. TKW24L]|uniref:hypothetical protein n=1 Tax=Aquiflexum sp. TKW24L TaxID=2942212 RepID=UPI0020BDF94B|nr:hypothetical protein [Aquiflexum sp. TKW24L]MCL6257685.1 hypothetical protein [Aquiflexum sp. TKW24L]
MKKILMPLLAVVFMTSCGMESMTDTQPNQNLENNLLLKNGFTAQEESSSLTDLNSARVQVTDQYTILGTMSEGLATGFILNEGVPALITASGEVGFYFAGLGDPATPNGRPDAGSFNGFPVVSLVARVGGGDLQFVGTGPTQLTGSGEVVFYVNDSFFGDNSGSWNIQIAYECYHGPGYWKTHSEFGPAQYDETWALLSNGASTPFYLSGSTWLQVFNTAPARNAYYQLAHHFMAAKLNVLSGADPSAVSAELNAAEAQLNTYTPAQVAALPMNSPVRAQMLALASNLDNYNNSLSSQGSCN